MNNLITKTTELAMFVTLSYIKPGDTVVDATCGTGQDTLALAQAVGEEGKVYAFDVQMKALVLTETHLHAHGIRNVHLLKESFASIGDHVPEGSVAAVVFNLGYLPGGDHTITTEKEETLKGLEEALKAIRPGGVVTAVLYDGHEEGQAEKKAVISWAEQLDSKKYHAVYANMLNQKNHPPEILWITKK